MTPHVSFRIVLWLLLVPVSGAGAPPRVSLDGSAVRVEAWIADGQMQERYLAERASGEWTEVATSAGSSMGPVSLLGAGRELLPGAEPSIRSESGVLEETFRVGGSQLRRTIRVFGKNWLKITTVLTPTDDASLHSFTDRFRFSMRPDWSYSPSVGGFNPDAQYKEPVILVQSGSSAFGIVPDVSALTRDLLKRVNHAIDLDVPAGPLLTVGFIPARSAYHSVYAEDIDRSWTAPNSLANSYYLLVAATATPGAVYREAVRFEWRNFGRPLQDTAAAEQTGTDPRYTSLSLWDDWRRVVWDEESPAMWVRVPLPDGSTGGAVQMIRWGGPQPSLYLSAWFNSLRTALGMALYARREHKPALMELALQTLNAALKAPGRDGAFKCIGLPSAQGTVWAAGDGALNSTKGGFLGFDMAWTGFLMLRWREAGLPGSDAILGRCERLADFLVARQRADGMLPTRFNDDGGVETRLSNQVPAETGPVARFLFELYRQDHRRRYFDAAAKALAFLDRDVVPARKWYDFETFWSCTPRLVAFDERSAQWPANDLALLHVAGAYVAAFEASGDRSYLTRGEAVLDNLLLYQQVWTNPVLEGVTSPAMLLGGFTTQNSDAEWSDARQSLCGNVLMEYYRATGNPEYLERGVAALRAQFPISPSENWAHGGYGKKAGVSGFHWGSGSGMAGIEIEEDYFRDGVCDLAAGAGVGVNGLNIHECSVSGETIAVKMDSPFHWSRDPVLVFHRGRSGAGYRLTVNGEEIGVFAAGELEKGVPVPAPRQ